MDAKIYLFRGHHDDGLLTTIPDEESASNDGNFRALLRFRIDAGDTILENLLRSAAKNATYTSKTVQNEIITVIGEMMCKTVVQRALATNFLAF